MINSLRKKYIFAGILLTMGFLLFLIGTATVLQDGLVEKWNSVRMKELARETIQLLNKNDWKISQQDLDGIAFESDVYVTITDLDMNIQMSTRNWEVLGNKISHKTIETVNNNKDKLDKTGGCFLSNFKENNRASFLQINKDDGNGYVIIRKSVTGLSSSMMVMKICFVIAAILTLLCGIPVIVYLSGRMVKPIREINEITKQITNLNFEKKLAVHSKDELGDLAESVNIMSDKLKTAMENLQKDVEVRNNLVRNMSHELKTPTAVIMGYAENMPYISQEHPQKLEKYCNVIVTECERMDSIIQQMLQVSFYEYGESVLNIEKFSCERLLEGIRFFMESDYPDWNGTYKEENYVSSCVTGDYEVLRRGLYNYVKNAVRYGKKDGLILIKAWEDEKKIFFSVFNEGSTIPREEMENIWNVFYKINPARTRDQKSFGIGLSIAKQAALSHGGNVQVRNVGNGVEFELFVKKYN